MDFDKLFTEIYEQKFSLSGSHCQNICSHPGGNSIYSILEGDVYWSQSQSDGSKGTVEFHLCRGDGLGNKRK